MKWWDNFFLEESAKGPPVIYGGGRYTKGLAGSGAKCHFGECALPFTRPIHQLLPATLIPLAHNHFLLDGIKRAGQPPRCAPSIFRTKKNKERKQKQSQMYLPLLDWYYSRRRTAGHKFARNTGPGVRVKREPSNANQLRKVAGTAVFVATDDGEFHRVDGKNTRRRRRPRVCVRRPAQNPSIDPMPLRRLCTISTVAAGQLNNWWSALAHKPTD